MPIITLPAQVPPAFIATADFGVTSGTAAVSANLSYLMRLDRVNAPMLLSTASIHVGTAAGNFMIGLYTTTDAVITTTQATAASFTKVAATAETLMAGASVWQDVNFVTPYMYMPGMNLWAVFGSDNTATIGRQAVSNVIAPVHAKALAKTSGYAANTIITPIASASATALAPLIRLW